MEDELDDILSKIEAYQWPEDDEPTIDAVSIHQAKQALLRWREAYADKRTLKELKRIMARSTAHANTKDGLARTQHDLIDRISALRKQQGGLERPEV